MYSSKFLKVFEDRLLHILMLNIVFKYTYLTDQHYFPLLFTKINIDFAEVLKVFLLEMHSCEWNFVCI
jgi:hypothetical protein